MTESHSLKAREADVAPLEVVEPERAGFSSRRLGRIDAMMQHYVDDGKLSGGVALVARHGHVAHLRAFGNADLATGKPMQRDTLFRIYSMTKPITSVAVLMLMEEGLIRLSDPIANYIPAFKDTKVLASAPGEEPRMVDPIRPITIHDLLTHTTGLSHGLEAETVDDLFRARVGAHYFNPDATLETIIEEIASVPLAFQPGTAWKYSAGPDVLGYLVQVVSGMPFDVFLKQRLFGPLGMTDTDFWVPPEKRDRFAVMYTLDGQGKLTPAQPFPLAAGDYTCRTCGPMGTGGLVSTAGDYYRFAQMLLNGGVLDGARVLGRKTIELMASDHLPDGVHLNGSPAIGFGLGVSVLKDLGKSQSPGSVGTFAWGGAASTDFWIDPQEDLLGILMLQYLPPPMTTVPAIEDFHNLVYQALE
jgi:CubicO group peptidase (beta-lactamase class C family)